MTFAALKDMARVVAEHQSDQPEILGNVSTTLLEDAHRLYQILLEKKPVTEEEAIIAFFQHGKAEKQYYEQVKEKLEQILINSTLFINFLSLPRAHTYQKCYSIFLSAYLIKQLGGKVASVALFEQTFKISQQKDILSVAADTLFFLKGLYSGAQSNASKHSYYTILHKEFEEKRSLEALASMYYDNLIKYFTTNQIPNSKISAQAHTYYEELRSKHTPLSTDYYKLNIYKIGIIHFMASNNYQQALNLSETALEELSNRQNLARGSIVSLLAQKMLCIIHLKTQDMELASNTMNLFWKLTPKNTYNAFKGHELELFYSFHTRQYPKALQHYEKGRNHPLFPNLTGILRESWQLYGGYLHLLAELGQLDKKAVEKTVGPFRYSKFINDIKIMSKEKEGMNIPLVNLPILFSLAKGDGNFPEEYMATLERYRKRYLRSDMNIRSASFVKLLLLLARKPFEGKNVDRKIEKELAVLRQQQPQFSRQTIAIEIIPYEDLWWLLTGTPV